MAYDIILFETEDKEIKLSVPVENETVWLNRSQLAELFERDVKTIGKHINNALKEELDNSVVANFATTESSSLNSSFKALLICLPIVLTSLSNSAAISFRVSHTVSLPLSITTGIVTSRSLDSKRTI